MFIIVILSILFVYTNPVFSVGKYQELYLDVPADHFSFSKSNETFKLRYLILEEYYVKGGPTFFYCGNEADITAFYENSGFLIDIAPMFNALVVFAEHRYYGQSMPYGKDSLSSPEYLRHLTTSQALADFVYLIDALTKKYYDTMITNDTYPVIAFGGSYGGMLAAWLRMKYPHIVLGAIASSAPLLQINNLKLCESFYHTVTQAFTKSENCSYIIRLSWQAIRNVTETSAGKKNLTELFKLCKPLSNDVNKFIDGLTDIYVNLAMLNYPYPTNFLIPLPANPVKTFCDKLKSFGFAETSLDLLKAIASALEISTNFTGKTKCNSFETTIAQPVDYAWDFQACFELIMPTCSTKEDMFEVSRWDYKNFSFECTKKYGVVPYSPDKVLTEHGGKILKYASNIVFSNGLIDPWYGGGILNNISDSVVAVLIPEAAHHYDLRGANPVDSNFPTNLESQGIWFALLGLIESHSNVGRFALSILNQLILLIGAVAADLLNKNANPKSVPIFDLCKVSCSDIPQKRISQERVSSTTLSGVGSLPVEEVADHPVLIKDTENGSNMNDAPPVLSSDYKLDEYKLVSSDHLDITWQLCSHLPLPALFLQLSRNFWPCFHFF